MDREGIDNSTLTDQQLEILDILSIDCGLTNRQVTANLGKKEAAEGNIDNKIKPLIEMGMIYKVKDKYPNKLLFIVKSSQNMNKIMRNLDDPINGRLSYYDRILLKEEVEFNKTRYNNLNNYESDDYEPILSDKGLKARSNLISFIHLYLWCKDIQEEYRLRRRNSIRNQSNIYHRFTMTSLIPPCRSCRKIYYYARIEMLMRERQSILWGCDPRLIKMKSKDNINLHFLRDINP